MVDYLVFGAWADPTAFSFPYSRRFSESARLPVLWGDVHMGLLVAVTAAAIVAAVLHRTTWGYEIRTIGASPAAARYAGMPIRRRILVVMAASGALAGLAGTGEVAGVIHRIQQGISPGYGFSAIIVAWVARLTPAQRGGRGAVRRAAARRFRDPDDGRAGGDRPHDPGADPPPRPGERGRAAVGAPPAGHGGGPCGARRAMTAEAIVALLAVAVTSGTPLIFAGVGERLAERSGVLNLGVERG